MTFRGELRWIDEPRWLGRVRMLEGVGLGMLSHAQARQAVIQGFEAVMGRSPSLCEAQLAQAVALTESSYGAGWGAAGAGSYNMGAIQAGKPPCGPGTFEYTDSHPDGTNYQACFRSYGSAAEGFAALIKVMYVNAGRASVLAAASRCDIKAFSTAMYDTGYYEGSGPTREARIAWHVKRITDGLKKITAALKEPMPSPSAITPVQAGSLGLFALAAIGVLAYGAYQIAKPKKAA